MSWDAAMICVDSVLLWMMSLITATVLGSILPPLIRLLQAAVEDRLS